MCEGYQPAGEDDHSGLDDEFLCEYVDGTMDPAVREVFEEYLRDNPAVAEHVERLRHTRRLLCQYGCRCKAPQGLQTRLRRELAGEMIRAQMPLFPVVTSRLRAMAAFTSAMAVMLVVGMTAGVVLSEADAVQSSPGASTAGSSAMSMFPDYRQASAILLPHAISSYAHPRNASASTPVGSYSPARAMHLEDRSASDTLQGALLLRRSSVAP